MAVLLLILTAVVLFLVTGAVRHALRRVDREGSHLLLWRWLSAGTNWSGKAVTNRGLTRPGTRALTATGYAHRRWHWPRWLHAAWRIQWTVAVLLTGTGLLVCYRRTEDYLAASALAGGGYGLWRGAVRARDHHHRSHHVKPLHVRLHHHAGIPLAMRPESWLEVPRDLSYVQVTWPKNAALPKAEDRRLIESVVASTIPGMKGARPHWMTVGPQLRLKMLPPVLPPLECRLDSINWGYRNAPDLPGDAILKAMRAAGADELVLGIGEGAVIVKVSTEQDSAHYALSVDTGMGKSVLVRCIVPQVLFRGGIAMILDNKLVSHPSLRGLDNVAYADDIDKIHDALCWLDGELTKRAKYIREHTDHNGVLYGSPGPRLFIILEEQNLLMNRLRAYWAEQIAEDKSRDKDDRLHLPATSPAIKAFENASYVGRELRVHLVFISQRFTAEAAGGGAKGAAVRMNAGTRILAGYDDDTWKMLVGKNVPMPPPSRTKGRMQVYVKGREPQEVQIAFFTHQQARQLASEGDARVPAKLHHLTTFRPSSATASPVSGIIVTGGGNGTAAPVAPPAALPPAVQNWMSINQAREQGLLPRSWSTNGAFRTAKHRASKAGIKVPAVQATRKGEALYDAIELADFLERIAA